MRSVPAAACRVLVVARHLVGGIRSYLAYNYGHLDARSFHVTVLAPAGGEEGLLRQQLQGLDVEWILVGERPTTLALAARTLVTCQRHQHDLVHSQGMTAAMMVEVANALTKRTPHVATLHEVLRPAQFDGLAGRARQIALRALLPRVGALNVVSQDARDNLLRHVPSLRAVSHRLHVIPHGVDVAAFSAVCHARSTRQPPTRHIFAFLGRFMPEKGFAQIIEAAATLHSDPEARDRFVVVAMNEGRFIREYGAEIARRGLSGCFEFRSLASTASALLAEADTVLMPSLWEAAGLVAMEALVSGCPVIASDCIGLREVTADTPVLHVRAGDSSSLAEAMKRSIHEARRLEADARCFAPIAAARFDSHRSGEELAALLCRTASAVNA